MLQVSGAESESERARGKKARSLFDLLGADAPPKAPVHFSQASEYSLRRM